MDERSIKAGMHPQERITASLQSNPSRRDMLKLMALAGLSASAGGLLLTGRDARAAEPKRGGRIRVAASNSSVSESMDPAKSSSSGDYIRQFTVYSGLTELDANMRAQPALAESIESDDGKVWAVKLRKGVTFHNGKAFDAQDVVFSLMRHKDPATASKAKVLADQFASVTAVNANEVRIELTSPNIDLPALLSTSHFLILADGTTDFAQPNGTGPFKCKEFKPAARMIGTRNENFWKPGLPHLDEVEILGITDLAARVNGLLAGDLHMVAVVSPRDLDRIRASGKHDILETKSGLYSDLVLRQDAEPTNNHDFVLAMKYLQNRERLVDNVLRGFGTIANDHPVPPWHPYFLKDLPQRPYDLDRAKYHIEKGGLKGTRASIVCTPGIEAAVEGAQLLQQSARAAGLTLEVRRVPYDGYWSTHWMKHPISYGSVNPRPTLDTLFTQFYKSDAAWNESAWKNEQFDQLLEQSRKEKDEARRKQMYGDMQTLITNHCGVIIPSFISFLDAYDTRLKGLAPNPMGMLMGYRFAEHVWLDA